MEHNFFELNARTGRGNDCLFSGYRGSVVLVVNTASRCGFTPQYRGLEALHRKYQERGLVVLGFPCDQFAHQEPGSDEEIASFCQINFGVTFPLMAKVEVNGKASHPVFVFLKNRASGFFSKAVKWNFTKFLVGRDGLTVRRFSPRTEPEKLEKYIEAALDA
jgi:glutathione peroxidase